MAAGSLRSWGLVTDRPSESWEPADSDPGAHTRPGKAS